MKELDYLKQKVCIIAFLEFVFTLGKDDRNIPFSVIARVCNVELFDVEMLVMKAMSLELVRGSIDEAAEKVDIRWIMPRYLSKDNIRTMVARMKEWEAKMDQVTRFVQNESDELLNKWKA